MSAPDRGLGASRLFVGPIVALSGVFGIIGTAFVLLTAHATERQTTAAERCEKARPSLPTLEREWLGWHPECQIRHRL